MFNCIKNILPIFAKRLLYHAHVISYCMYGLQFWGPMITSAQLNKLEKNRMNKFVLNSKNIKRSNNITLLYRNKELNLLKFSELKKSEQAKFVYNLVNYTLPKAIISEFNPQQHTYNSRNRNTPMIRKHTSNICNKSFISKAIIIHKTPRNSEDFQKRWNI